MYHKVLDIDGHLIHYLNMVPRQSFLALVAATMPIATISTHFPSFEIPNGPVYGAYMYGWSVQPTSHSLLYFNLPLTNPCFTQDQYRQWTREGAFYTRLVYKIHDGDKACRTWWEENLPNQDIDLALSLLEA